MARVTFNEIPDDVRTPGVYAEIDNSRALKGLVANPHKVLILGQKIAAGIIPVETLAQITSDTLSEGYFGNGSLLDLMCKKFKANNQVTEAWAMALSCTAGVQASGHLCMSNWMSGNALSTGGVFHLMINGVPVPVTFNIGDEGDDMAVAISAAVHDRPDLPVTVTTSGIAGSEGVVVFQAICNGSQGNDIDIRQNYFEGEFQPCSQDHSVTIFDTSAEVGGSVGFKPMAGGTVQPDQTALWPVIDGEQFHYIIHAWPEGGDAPDTELLDSAHEEMSDRASPMEDLQGHIFCATRNNLASATLIGNSVNSPWITILPADNSPNHPAEWAAALGGVASKALEDDPARPLHYLRLGGYLLPPPLGNRYSRAEREASLLYDGLATFIVDANGYPVIERCITTYQTNVAGTPDASYLDIQTLATLSEIKYQLKARMITRFILPRFKLADDTFPVQPGSHVATPKTVRQEIIALFTFLRDKGLIENLSDFIDNLVVERDDTDVNRVNVLLPADLINQFRILAAQIQFIL